MINKRIIFAKKFILILFFGTFAGFINGLLGSGGGVILIISLQKIFKGQDKRILFATSLASLIPMSAVSFFFYQKHVGIPIDYKLFSILIPSFFGGYIGSLLLPKLKGKMLNLLFSLILLYSGIRMILR